MYYEIKLKVTKMGDSGEPKDFVEHYITDQETFAGAECAGLEIYNGSCDVFVIVRSKVREITRTANDGEKFFRATVCDVYTDDSGKEKEMKYVILLPAKDIEKAHNDITEYLKQGFDMTLKELNETKILSVL